ncbi:thermonuclease family protein [Viridibacillus arvi]|uniref:thermonuclease family protein n=1 Tax=Viridibacillus arvi TaxID=263475 RepID=UPI0034CFF0C2
MKKKLLTAFSLALLLLTGCSEVTKDASTDVVGNLVDDVSKEGKQVVEDKKNDIIDTLKEKVSLGVNKTTSKNRFTTKVVEVTDGDTLKIKYNGELTTVRILNIDTPEVYGPKAGQKYGSEASNFAKKLLTGETVEIELSANESPYDKYDRLLAYVFIGGQLYEEAVIKEGFARIAYVYKPDTKYVDQLEAAEEYAKKNKLGIWSIPNYVKNNGYDMSVVY